MKFFMTMIWGRNSSDKYDETSTITKKKSLNQ